MISHTQRSSFLNVRRIWNLVSSATHLSSRSCLLANFYTHFFFREPMLGSKTYLYKGEHHGHLY